MSLDRIFKALVDLGLSETDSRVYLVIAVKGPMTPKKIIEEIKIKKQQLYPILKKLKNKKIIKLTNTRPYIITAVPFEIVLEMLINSEIEKTKKIQKSNKELITSWNSVNWNNNT